MALAKRAGDAVRVLHFGELNRHAGIVLADDTSPHSPENDFGLQWRLLLDGDRCAAQGHVDNAAVTTRSCLRSSVSPRLSRLISQVRRLAIFSRLY